VIARETRCGPRLRRAFTIIELMVVIAVIGLVISAVIVVAGQAIENQRRVNTAQTLKQCQMAAEQFRSLDPLRSVYGRVGKETFGDLPPYQLARPEENDALSLWQKVLRYKTSMTDAQAPELKLDELPKRLSRDIARSTPDDVNPSFVDFDSAPSGMRSQIDDGFDDIRAFYAYLRLYVPDALALIPENAVKSPRPDLVRRDVRAAVNPTGVGSPYGASRSNWQDVLGIVDAWGVPIDYMMYVKVEWSPDADAGVGEYVVRERRPVFRSRGASQDEVESAKRQFGFDNGNRFWTPTVKWIFSEPLPQPYLRFQGEGPPPNRELMRRGLILPQGGQHYLSDGWARAVGVNEDYFYTPEQDPVDLADARDALR